MEKTKILQYLLKIKDEISLKSINLEQLEQKRTYKKTEETKKKILQLLKNQFLNVYQISDFLNLTRQRALWYLHQLEKQGLIQAIKKGKMKYYKACK